MSNKDYLLREIEKISSVVARLFGLKEAGKTDEFIKLADSTVLTEFNIHLDELLDLSADDFIQIIGNNNYGADKLDALAQLLYLTFDIDDYNQQRFSIFKKVISIFDLLETKYHRQSFDNIQKRNIISTFLAQNE